MIITCRRCGEEMDWVDYGENSYSSIWKCPKCLFEIVTSCGGRLMILQNAEIKKEAINVNIEPMIGEFLNVENISQNRASPTSARIESSGVMKPSKFGGERMELDLEVAGKTVKWRPNKTGLITIGKKFGNETEEWVGKLIQIYAIEQLVQGTTRKVVVVL